MMTSVKSCRFGLINRWKVDNETPPTQITDIAQSVDGVNHQPVRFTFVEEQGPLLAHGQPCYKPIAVAIKEGCRFPSFQSRELLVAETGVLCPSL